MKRTLSLLLALFIILTCTTALSELDITVLDLHNATDEELEDLRLAVVAEQKSRIKTKIVFDQENISIGKGSTIKIQANVTDIPDGVKSGKIIWNTADKTIATVNNGSIRGINEGKTIITCSTTLNDGTELSADCEVTVITLVKTISFKVKKDKVFIGDKYFQEINIKPENASNKIFLFESSDPSIATVDEKGEVSLIGTGTVTITATTTDGSNKTASYSLISESPPGMEIYKYNNSPAQYDAEIKFQDIEWEQSDKSVVDALVAKGLIDKYYFNGTGGRPCFCWPEADTDLQIKYNNRILPEIIRENGWIGSWKLDYISKKKIGGHDPNALSLHFLSNIKRYNTISDNCDRLIAISVLYNTKSTEIPIPEMFIDLLTKLSAQYGQFDVYINADIESNRELNKEYGKITAKDLSSKVTTFASSIFVSKFEKNGVLAFATIHGKNNTAIALRLLQHNELELIYSKTDTYCRCAHFSLHFIKNHQPIIAAINQFYISCFIQNTILNRRINKSISLCRYRIPINMIHRSLQNNSAFLNIMIQFKNIY